MSIKPIKKVQFGIVTLSTIVLVAGCSTSSPFSKPHVIAAPAEMKHKTYDYVGTDTNGSVFRAVLQKTETATVLRAVGYKFSGSGIDIESLTTSRGYLAQLQNNQCEVTVPLIVEMPTMLGFKPMGQWPEETVVWYTASITVEQGGVMACHLRKSPKPATDEANQFSVESFSLSSSQAGTLTAVGGKFVTPESTRIKPCDSYNFVLKSTEEK
jgi:hypothetical protein